MSEAALWDMIRKPLRPLDPQRVENSCGKGTPDVNYVGGWLELKQQDNWPKRPTTKVRLDHDLTNGEAKFFGRSPIDEGIGQTRVHGIGVRVEYPCFRENMSGVLVVLEVVVYPTPVGDQNNPKPCVGTLVSFDAILQQLLLLHQFLVLMDLALLSQEERVLVDQPPPEFQ